MFPQSREYWIERFVRHYQKSGMTLEKAEELFEKNPEELEDFVDFCMNNDYEIERSWDE